MTNSNIRKASLDDLRVIVDLERENNSSLWKSASFQSAMNETSQEIYILELGKRAEVVGYLVGMLAADELTLLHIVVAKEYRNQGFAKQLYDYWLSEVGGSGKSNEFKQVWLEVRESNQSAQALYHKLGFEEVVRRKNYYKNPKETAVLMRSDI